MVSPSIKLCTVFSHMTGASSYETEDVLIHFPWAYVGYLSKNPLKAHTWVHKVNFSIEGYSYGTKIQFCASAVSLYKFLCLTQCNNKVRFLATTAQIVFRICL